MPGGRYTSGKTMVRELGLDRPSLQKWTDRLEPRASTKPHKIPRGRLSGKNAAPAFVELLAASTGTATSCLVEVESTSGSKLRLDLKGIATRETKMFRGEPFRPSATNDWQCAESQAQAIRECVTKRLRDNRRPAPPKTQRTPAYQTR